MHSSMAALLCFVRSHRVADGIDERAQAGKPRPNGLSEFGVAYAVSKLKQVFHALPLDPRKTEANNKTRASAVL